MQSLEYLRSFIQRQSMEYLGGHFVIAGAFTVLSKESVVGVEGFKNTTANDMEIIMSLQRHMREGKKREIILHLADPVVWTVGPSTFKTLAKQRIEWQKGICESLAFHKKMILNPKYGSYGLFVLPFCVIWSEILEPFVELIAYIYIIIGLIFGWINFYFLLLVIAIAYFISVASSLLGLLIEESSFKRFPSFYSLRRLIGYSLIESFGYRQCSIYWRIKGTLQFLRNAFSKKTKRENRAHSNHDRAK